MFLKSVSSSLCHDALVWLSLLDQAFLFLVGFERIVLYHVVHVLISSARKVHENRLILRHSSCYLYGVTESMGALESGDDPFESAQIVECDKCISVGSDHIVHPFNIFEMTMLRSNSWIIESAGYRIDWKRITSIILKQIAAETVKNTFFSIGHGCSVITRRRPTTSRFDAHELHLCIIEKSTEYTHGIRSAADTGHDIIR